MGPKLLGQKYTYIKSNIWLNAPSPLSLQLGVSDRHPQTFGSPLAEFLNIPFDLDIPKCQF